MRIPGEQPQACRAIRSLPGESETASGSEVLLCEGNEAPRDGRQEVVVLHSTDEVGELAPARTRPREGMHQVTNTAGGKHAGDFGL